MAALAAEVVVELDAELDEIGDARRRLLGEHAHRALAAEAAAGAQRVLGVQRRARRRRRARPRRRPARASCSTRRPDPSRASSTSRLGGRAERRVQAGDTATDDDQIVARLPSEVFSSKSITCRRVYMVSDPRAKTSTPFHAVLAVVLQVRDGRLQVLLWERALEPFRGSWSLPGGTLAAGRDARAVDPPPPRDEGRRARALPPRAARDAQRARPQPASAGSSRPPTSASSRATSTPACPTTRAGIPVDELPRSSRSTTGRSCSPAASGCARSSRTRTSASRSRPTSSRSRSCATSTAPRSGTTSRRRTSSACCCAAHLLVPTGEPPRAGPDRRPPGGALPLPRAASSRSPTSSRCCGRRAELAASGA